MKPQLSIMTISQTTFALRKHWHWLPAATRARGEHWQQTLPVAVAPPPPSGSSSPLTQHRQSVDGSGVPDVILRSIPYVVRVRCSNYRIGTGLVVQQRSESRRDSFDALGSLAGCGPPGWLLLTARLVTCTVTLAVVLATVYALGTLKRSSRVFKFPTNS